MKIKDLVVSLTPEQRKAILWFWDSTMTIPAKHVWMAWSPRDDPSAPSPEVMYSLLRIQPTLIIVDSGQVLHRLSAYGKRVRRLLM